tara:strand:+ start:38526 stop:39458 length:933 start_codon:yes stop_codon:yes gene_type:complete
MEIEFLITGGAGFIGSKVCANLENNNIDYLIVDDLSKGKINNVIDKKKFIELDCSSNEFQNWLKSIRPKHIIHLCGQSSGERSHEDPSNDFIRNVLTTRRIISASESNENLESLSFASSMSVYGNKLNANENDIPEPLSWYGKHKLLSEKLIRDFSKIKPNLKCNCLRLFNVYGKGQDLSDLKQGMVSIFIAMAIKNKKIIVKGPSNRIRDFINVKDVVQAFLNAAKRNKGNNYEVFNIAAGLGIKINYLVDFIASEVNTDFQYKNERTPFDQDYCSANISKSKIILDFSPRYELESELKEMINWAKKIL